MASTAASRRFACTPLAANRRRVCARLDQHKHARSSAPERHATAACLNVSRARARLSAAARNVRSDVRRRLLSPWLHMRETAARTDARSCHCSSATRPARCAMRDVAVEAVASSAALHRADQLSNARTIFLRRHEPRARRSSERRRRRAEHASAARRNANRSRSSSRNRRI
eukprot:1879410-Pleurochrysis_carterae.AAC.5